MTTYRVYCDTCDADYTITLQAETEDVPNSCAFCSENISEENLVELEESNSADGDEGWSYEYDDDSRD